MFACVCPGSMIITTRQRKLLLYCMSARLPTWSQHSLTRSRSYLHVVALRREQIGEAANGLNNMISQSIIFGNCITSKNIIFAAGFDLSGRDGGSVM